MERRFGKIAVSQPPLQEQWFGGFGWLIAQDSIDGLCLHVQACRVRGKTSPTESSCPGASAPLSAASLEGFLGSSDFPPFHLMHT